MRWSLCILKPIPHRRSNVITNCVTTLASTKKCEHLQIARNTCKFLYFICIYFWKHIAIYSLFINPASHFSYGFVYFALLLKPKRGCCEWTLLLMHEKYRMLENLEELQPKWTNCSRKSSNGILGWQKKKKKQQIPIDSSGDRCTYLGAIQGATTWSNCGTNNMY